MKDKKYIKKLVLNKRTLACLENGEMSVIKAGGSPWLDRWNSVEPCPTNTCAP